MPHNIILFLTDQWRWDTFNDPNSLVQLPKLKQFALRATNYTNAFSPVPLCTPARASLFTGKWPHQTGTLDNVQGRSYYPQGCLHKEQKTYLERLRDDGYEVAYIGKWHLGEGGLLERGISTVIRSDGGDEPIPKKPVAIEHEGPYLPPYYGKITTDTPADGLRVADAIKQLKALKTSEKPFCLVVSLHGPHFPHFVPSEFVELYDDLPEDYVPPNYSQQFTGSDKPVAQSRSYWPCQETASLTSRDWRLTTQHYFGFCSYIDHLFGRFEEAVTKNELDSNTVFAFTSDHGEMLGAHGWFDKGPFFYDEVIRIPMLIRTPESDGAVSQENFVSLRDLWPALLDAANSRETLHQDELQRSYLRSNEEFVTYCYDSYQGRHFKIRGIRGKRYKYAWSPHDSSELYDLEIDPFEQTNLTDNVQYSDIQNKLHNQLFDWMERESDAIRVPAYHLPIGSYVDGRDRSYDPNNELPGR